MYKLQYKSNLSYSIDNKSDYKDTTFNDLYIYELKCSVENNVFIFHLYLSQTIDDINIHQKIDVLFLKKELIDKKLFKYLKIGINEISYYKIKPFILKNVFFKFEYIFSDKEKLMTIEYKIDIQNSYVLSIYDNSYNLIFKVADIKDIRLSKLKNLI